MDIRAFMLGENEKPLDRFPADGGFCGIFRTIGCIGDSLSSGELESMNEKGEPGYHDYYDQSWGQYLARIAGCKVYNFSRGGMTAADYWNSFAEENGFWDEDKKCQAYIIALGVNDLLNQNQEMGSTADIDLADYNNNKNTFAGYYARIIQRLKEAQPKARFFLMNFPRSTQDQEPHPMTKLLYEFAELFSYTYVLDIEKYGPVYDAEFKKNFYLGGHLNTAGYLLTGKMVASYLDYIVRQNFEDFSQIGFVGTEFHNCFAKW